MIYNNDDVVDRFFRYLQELSQYLQSFLERAQPLLNLHSLLEEEEQTFNQQWQDGQVAGWEIPRENNLYCAACDKLFSKETVFNAHLTGKKHVKAAERLGKTSNNTNQDVSVGGEEQKRELAWLEFKSKAMLRVLQKEVEDTKGATERKLTLTHEELSNRFVRKPCSSPE